MLVNPSEVSLVMSRLVCLLFLLPPLGVHFDRLHFFTDISFPRYLRRCSRGNGDTKSRHKAMTFTVSCELYKEAA